MKLFVLFFLLTFFHLFCASNDDIKEMPWAASEEVLHFVVDDRHIEEFKYRIIEGPSIDKPGVRERHYGLLNDVYIYAQIGDTLRKDKNSFYHTLSRKDKDLIIPLRIGRYYYIGKCVASEHYFQGQEGVNIFEHLSSFHDFIVKEKRADGTSFTILGNTVKGIQYPDSFSDQTGEIYRLVQVGDTLFKEINEFDIVVKKGTGAIRFPYYYEGYYYWGKRLELHPDTPYIIVPKLKQLQ